MPTDHKLTRQGLRDLNGPGGYTGTPRRRRIEYRCPHVWDEERVYDCWLDEVVIKRHCGLCHATKG